jgi:DNA-binding HxlR family transcriptional regulator
MEFDACPGPIEGADCSTRLVLDRIGDRWTVLIVDSLSGGPLRFSKLREAVGAVTPKVLAETLRALQRDGMVTRAAYAGMPPRVEYALTDLGRALRSPIDAVRSWAEANAGDLVAARAKHDERSR